MGTKKLILSLAVAVICCYAAAYKPREMPEPTWTAPQGQIVDDDREIWQVVLSKQFPDERKLMVFDEVLSDGLYSFQMFESNDEARKSPAEAFREFVRNQLHQSDDDASVSSLLRNSVTTKITGTLLPSRPQALFTREKSDEVFGHNHPSGKWGWGYFYELYPNSYGVITLALPGYDSSRTTAIVYVGNQSGGLAGKGIYYSLSKKSGRWEITGEAMSWIS